MIRCSIYQLPCWYECERRRITQQHWDRGNSDSWPKNHSLPNSRRCCWSLNRIMTRGCILSISGILTCYTVFIPYSQIQEVISSNTHMRALTEDRYNFKGELNWVRSLGLWRGYKILWVFLLHSAAWVFLLVMIWLLLVTTYGTLAGTSAGYSSVSSHTLDLPNHGIR
jgi:hypothetical protein